MSRNSLKGKTLAAAMGIALLAGSATAFAGGDRYECRGFVAGKDANMDARFEVDGDRKKFSVSFEAAPDSGFGVGDTFDVEVRGKMVATMEFDAERDALGNVIGDIIGEVNFDTTAQADDADGPFPVNFPTDTGAKTKVEVVGTAYCALQVR